MCSLTKRSDSDVEMIDSELDLQLQLAIGHVEPDLRLAIGHVEANSGSNGSCGALFEIDSWMKDRVDDWRGPEPERCATAKT